jgi:hypothetical protein
MSVSIEAKVATVSSPVFLESVADILERELHPLIKEWITRVEKEPELMRIPLNYEERTGPSLRPCTIM